MVALNVVIAVFGYGLISMFLVALFHEAGHILAGSLFRLKPKSIGFGTPYKLGIATFYLPMGGLTDLDIERIPRFGRVVVVLGGPAVSAIIGTALWMWAGHFSNMWGLRFWAFFSIADVVLQLMIWPIPKWPTSDGIYVWKNITRQPPEQAGSPPWRPSLAGSVVWDIALLALFCVLIHIGLGSA